MPESQAHLSKSPIAFVSDYPPRRCGIATFTHDLCEAVALQGGSRHDVFVLSMNDVPEGYPYPDRVRFEVRQSVQADYRMAAEFLNISQVSTVCLQHEYGIYGGAYGSHILALLRRLRRPLVTTLHTILKEPNEQQHLVLQEIGRLSDRLVVMSNLAAGILRDVYDVPAEKVVMIPHGIPDVPFIDPSFYKDQFGVEGRKVMLTFGLLSPGKGIEYAIEALPRIITRHPEIVYIVLGATHPHVKREFGEQYRNGLLRRVAELKLKDHVIFHDRFVKLKELCEFIGAADIYITPYLGEAQITSGTLAYALGAGKATISTPYW
ncbi:MAG: glycosyltransferase family 4 protein, partial [Planctomycetes bacterium]|nr:glycosyltransferase family 4 protein [Planctomycetota bacterium]